MTAVAPQQPTPAHQLSSPHTPSTEHPRMSSSSAIPRGAVTSNLMFYAPPADGSKPFNYVEAPPPGKPVRNFGDTEVAVEVQDIRGEEHRYSLDNNAVEALANVGASAETEFADDDHIKQVYYPEIERLLLDNVPGAQRIILFDHTIRRADPDAPRAPVTRVHIDQTAASAAQRVRTHVSEAAEAARLLKGRYRIINVWRPLNGPVLSFPLAFADSATVSDDDLVGVEHIYPTKSGETAAVKYNPGQKWLYWSGMDNSERLLLKCFDSDERYGQTGRLPHTAFVDPRTPEGAPRRESIEVRALVFG